MIRAALAFLLGLACTAPALAEAPAGATLAAPGNGQVRALVVGIDHYHHVVALKGAEADARDIDGALKKMGAKDVTTLTADQASRDELLRALDDLLERTRTGDLVILALAGHGAKEPERVKGSSRDGSDEVFLLVDFDANSRTGATQKILNHEFNHYILAFEKRGAQVIFIADTCYGGGLAREITAGAQMSFRQVPRYRLVANDFKPVSTDADAFVSDLDFTRTTVLAAVDSDTKAPEVIIDGAYRGALSYAMARAFEGAADERGDGAVTTRELLAYTRRVVYQLSDERQNISTPMSAKRSIDSEIVLEVRSPNGAGGDAKGVRLPVASMPKLRLATTSRRRDALAGVKPLVTPFEVVSPDADADVVWDVASNTAVSGGDIIALNVNRDDIGGVLDRTAAVRDVKLMVAKAPQTMRVIPDASLHHNGNRIDVELGDLDGRSLVIVDVTGNGTVQLIYPSARSRPTTDRDTFRVPFRVRDPYGADEVMAVTSKQKLDALVVALHDLDGRKDAGRLAALIAKHAPPDARFGLVGLFTVP